MKLLERFDQTCIYTGLRAEFVMTHSFQHFRRAFRASPLGGGGSQTQVLLQITLVICHSSDHRRIVRSFSMDADAIKFRVGCVSIANTTSLCPSSICATRRDCRSQI